VNLVSQYKNFTIVELIGVTVDGGGGDNWSYSMCKAPVKSSSPTNHNPSFLQAIYALPVTEPCQSTEGKWLNLKLCISNLISSFDSAQMTKLLSVITRHMRQLRSRPCGGVTSVTFRHTHMHCCVITTTPGTSTYS